MFTKTALVAFFAAVALAIDPTTQWVSDNPTIKPAKGENVPAGVPYVVEWTHTTSNPISIWLYKGPAIDVKPQFALVSGIPNNGKATITIPTTVENSAGEGYGLQLRDDVTGQYQYTPQFGITGAGKPGSSSSASASSVASSTLGGGYPTGPATTSIVTSTSVQNSTTAKPTTTIHSSVSGYSNSTVVLPTKTPTVPVTLRSTTSSGPTATTSGPALSTGAAGILKAGLGLAAGVAGFVAML